MNAMRNWIVCLTLALAGAVSAAPRANLLIITVDDMSADSIGAFGCKLAETTPTIDRLAAQGVRLSSAHVVVGNCMPSRNCMWSGLYPHNNGVVGFYQVPGAKHLHLVDLMKTAGYFTGIRGKVGHSTPYAPYAWDAELETMPDGRKAHPKDPQSYGHSTAEGIRRAKAAGKPFCLMLNISDPHKPFYAEGNKGQTVPDPHVPTRVFKPEEVPVPGFLFDDPVVRKELAHYYSSVRRADDCAAEILTALKNSGEEPNTLILFLSDHGMPLPFAKTQLYHHSTRTPMFFVWPGVLKPGAVDDRLMVSAVDLLPTLLELLGVRHPGKMDGRSFAAALKGGELADRDFVIKEYHENSGGALAPMRAIQSRKYLYIFNPWSDGQRVMATATTGTPTYRRMAELAKEDQAIAERHDLFRHRVVEELYDVENDPDCLRNLIKETWVRHDLDQLRARLEASMRQSSDPMLETFLRRDDPAARAAYMEKAREEKAATTKTKGKGGKKAGKGAAAAGKRADLITLEAPSDVQAGKSVTLVIAHRLPADLGEQTLQVTLKGGQADKRIERKTLKISGEGKAKVAFDLPADVPDKVIRFAAFVGEDFPSALQHVQSAPIAVR